MLACRVKVSLCGRRSISVDGTPRKQEKQAQKGLPKSRPLGVGSVYETIFCHQRT